MALRPHPLPRRGVRANPTMRRVGRFVAVGGYVPRCSEPIVTFWQATTWSASREAKKGLPQSGHGTFASTAWLADSCSRVSIATPALNSAFTLLMGDMRFSSACDGMGLVALLPPGVVRGRSSALGSGTGIGSSAAGCSVPSGAEAAAKECQRLRTWKSIRERKWRALA